MKFNRNLEAALSYARRGWHVYPSRTKRGGYGIHWSTEATTNERQITAYKKRTNNLPVKHVSDFRLHLASRRA